MKAAFGSAMLGLAVLAGSAWSQPATTPVGTWMTEDGRAKIRIEHCAEHPDAMCGFVVWMKEPLNEKGQPRTDINNPDPAKRSRPSLGLELLTELKADEDGKFAGEIYNPENGKMYAVTVNAESATTLHLKGCMMRILCGSQSWERVADLAIPGHAAAAVAATKAAVKPAGAHLHDAQPSH